MLNTEQLDTLCVLCNENHGVNHYDICKVCSEMIEFALTKEEDLPF